METSMYKISSTSYLDTYVGGHPLIILLLDLQLYVQSVRTPFMARCIRYNIIW